MKKWIYLLLFTSLATSLTAQVTVSCPGVATTFSTGFNNKRVEWRIRNRNTGTELNGTVATINGSRSLFGARIENGNSVSIRFDNNVAARDEYTIEFKRFNNGFIGIGSSFQGSGTIFVDVPVKAPLFFFGGASGECGATLFLPIDVSQEGVTYNWFRRDLNNNFIPIANNTTSITVQPPFVPIRVEGTSAQCNNESASYTQTPPSVLGNLSITDGGIGYTVCLSPGQEFTATAKFCLGDPNGWTWSTSGLVQFTSAPIVSGSTSSINFVFVGTGFATIFVNNGNGNGQLGYNVLSFPNCEFLSRDPKGNGDPNSLEKDVSKAQKTVISDENTEGGGDIGLTNANKSTLKKSLYPNPASDVLNVENIEEVQSIEITDLNGRVVKIVTVEENDVLQSINVSTLSNGMYIIKKIKRDGQMEAAKFQVMHQ